MGKAEGELYHLTEAEVRKREEKIGSKRDFQIEEGRIRGIAWMLQMLHVTLASLTPTPYSPKISGFRNSIRMNKEHHCLLFYHSNCDNQKVTLLFGKIVFFLAILLENAKFLLHVCSKVAQFHRDGYITLPDVLSDKELVLLEEIYMSLIRYCRRVFLSQSF